MSAIDHNVFICLRYGRFRRRSESAGPRPVPAVATWLGTMNPDRGLWSPTKDAARGARAASFGEPREGSDGNHDLDLGRHEEEHVALVEGGEAVTEHLHRGSEELGLGGRLDGGVLVHDHVETHAVAGEHVLEDIGEAVAGALYLFSGAIFPLDVLPIALQPLGYLMPITYWLELIRRALVGEVAQAFPTLAGFSNSQLLAILSSLTLFFTVFSVFSFRRLEHAARERGMIDMITNY